MAKQAQYDYIYYGTRCKAGEVVAFVRHVLQANMRAEARGQRKTPICIWGRHGIGKTEIVQALAEQIGYRFRYIAPAQFEEMGDLVGMPSIEGGRTVFRSPEWVPQEEGPGILLIDDVNRADDRILRGIMQLLQNFELVSWKLPPKWQIILTANPDGGDYSVTPMDDAMITRMMHITLEFDPREWAKWAEQNGIDSRGIDFVLTYPEVVTGLRTTPRTLVQFFETIAGIDNLGANLGLVRTLADSCLDQNTAATFIAFVNQELRALVKPQLICDTRDFTAEVELPLRKIVQKKSLRVDILATICTRLSNYLTLTERPLDGRQLQNVIDFIKLDFLPNDLRLTLAQDLADPDKPNNSNLLPIMEDPEIGKILLEGM
ncbi:MAG: AAA family ATPase [Phaeodactylibacter sp.]|nr:AAA family ATPase [Phaeodactylibacter sp.]MCB9264232.1 AAA family ATPase [Lewinellaceae bacterium]MCB9291250.1 AAA family ATPase [Lewinellaceae bacterium]